VALAICRIHKGLPKISSSYSKDGARGNLARTTTGNVRGGPGTRTERSTKKLLGRVGKEKDLKLRGIEGSKEGMCELRKTEKS
jgi:hypothetical protein